MLDRSRNRGGNGNNSRGRTGQNRSQVFDSNGPDVRIRGTAYQIHEKYMALARDAGGIGDRILAESYLQHAEHYQRVINSWQDDAPRRAPAGEESVERDNFNSRMQENEDNLGLPASILGADTRTETMEDA